MMTPETLRIDKRFKGVGRLNRASGTTNPAIKRKFERMLAALYDDARLDVLRALRDGHVSFMQVYDAYQRRALHELPVGETMPELATAMESWIERSAREYSAEHLEALETSRRYFKKHEPAAQIADLPRLLDELRATLGAKHPRSFNMARTSALSFVRAMMKRSHPLYIACAAVEPRKLPKRVTREAITPEAMREHFPNPEEDVIDAIAWAMVTTGMGAKEYWGKWETRADRIHVHGTKRSGRLRDIPLARRPAVPRLSRDRFEKRFRERIGTQFTPYQLRRTYSQWLEAAGVPRTRRRMYMGHGVRDVTDLYEQHEVTTYLVEDAAKLAAYVNRKPPTISATTSPESSAIAERKIG
jgi:integrase